MFLSIGNGHELKAFDSDNVEVKCEIQRGYDPALSKMTQPTIYLMIDTTKSMFDYVSKLEQNLL